MRTERPISDSIISGPDEIEIIKKHAAKLIENAGAKGIFPTPIEKLLAAANIEEVYDTEEAHESFLKTATKETKAAFLSAFNKIRGFADLKRRVNYIAPEPATARQNWVKLHELGHQCLPWQKEAMTFVEDNMSLSLECEEEFEKEANAFAGEILFQGDTFLDALSSLRPDFNTVFHLANHFGASRHSAARQLALESDEPLALVSYYKSKRHISVEGKPTLILGRAHSASKKLLKKYPMLQLPQYVLPNHPWYSALTEGVQSGVIQLDLGDGSHTSFMWESWWNTYNLLIIIRKTPMLKTIKRFF